MAVVWAALGTVLVARGAIVWGGLAWVVALVTWADGRWEGQR